MEKLDFGITVFDKIGNPVCYTDSRIENKTIYNLKDKGHVDINLILNAFLPVVTTHYVLRLQKGMRNPDTIDYYPDAIGFEVLDNEFRIYATTKLEAEIELVE